MGDRCYAARIPLHVTGLWMPILSSNPAFSGSIGAGLLLEPAAEALSCSCSGRSRAVVRTPVGQLDGSEIETVKRVAASAGARLADLCFELNLPVPLGAGYAGSAAVALAASLSLAAVYGLSVEEAAYHAHVAEVEAGTGLGDVAAMLYGRGLELRLAPGAPGLARVVSIPLSANLKLVTASLGSMSTSEMHKVLADRLYSMTAPRIRRVFENASLEVFLEEARSFSVEAGFVDRSLAEKIDRIARRGSALGWYVKKKVLVVVSEEDRAEEVKAELEGLLPDARIFVGRPSASPLQVWEEQRGFHSLCGGGSCA